MNAGRYDVTVVYHGNDWYNESYTVAPFVVNKNPAPITINVTNSNVGDVEQINITLPAGAYGLVLLDIDGIQLYANATNGFAQINITGLKAGKHDFNVTYLGNYKFLSNKTNSSTVISIPGLAAGNYTVNATYNGNEYYNINGTESDKFEVRKADPELTILTVTGVVHDKGTLQITINGETAGEKVNITVVGEGVEYHYTVDIPADGMISFETPDTFNEYKPYHIIAEYGGNANFTSDVTETYFTPSKVNTYGLTINAMNITVGDDEIITVIVPDHVDDVVIWVNGESYRNHSFTGNTQNSIRKTSQVYSL